MGSPDAKPTDQSIRWIYSVLPINVALGPVGTFVQLYILELHGTVIDIGLATTLFSAVSIPAAIIWGFATDRMQTMKTIVVGSYLAVTIILASFLLAKSIYGVELLYDLFACLIRLGHTTKSLDHGNTAQIQMGVHVRTVFDVFRRRHNPRAAARRCMDRLAALPFTCGSPRSIVHSLSSIVGSYDQRTNLRV